MKSYFLNIDDKRQALISQWNAENNQRKALDVLSGICLGILADEEISEKEALFLRGWLEQHHSTLPDRIGIRLSQSLDTLLSETEPTNAVTYNFTNLLLDVIGHDNFDVSTAQTGRPNRLIFDDIEPAFLNIENAVACLSGAFEYGSKNKILDLLKLAGASATKGSPTKQTTLLIVGEKGSDQWQTSCMGAKIRKAFELKDSGQSILIIREETFLQKIRLLKLG